LGGFVFCGKLPKFKLILPDSMHEFDAGDAPHLLNADDLGSAKKEVAQFWQIYANKDRVEGYWILEEKRAVSP
jgi:hypothetical protein